MYHMTFDYSFDHIVFTIVLFLKPKSSYWLTKYVFIYKIDCSAICKLNVFNIWEYLLIN